MRSDFGDVDGVCLGRTKTPGDDAYCCGDLSVLDQTASPHCCDSVEMSGQRMTCVNFDHDPVSCRQTTNVNYHVCDVCDLQTSGGRRGDDLHSTLTGRGMSATCDDAMNVWQLALWNGEVLKAAKQQTRQLQITGFTPCAQPTISTWS